MSTANQGYEIKVDTSQHLVCATLHGHWDFKFASEFAQELHRALEDAASHTASVVTRLLIDARDQGVQSQDVVAIAGNRMIDFKGPRPRVALLVTSTLHKMQAARIASLDQQELFSSEQEALAWLLEEKQ